MEKELFEELVESLKEAAELSKGLRGPSRRFVVSPPEVRVLREKIGLSQSEFAGLMQVSIKTLQNWEQGRRNPTGPAAALLKIVAASPELAIKSLHV
jgi:DNA-binding transcriptional regulator YiaG